MKPDIVHMGTFTLTVQYKYVTQAEICYTEVFCQCHIIYIMYIRSIEIRRNEFNDYSYN